MSKDSIDEMEQIQRGLEEFLEKEVEGYREAERSAAQEGPVPIYTTNTSGYQNGSRETASGQSQNYYMEPEDTTSWEREEEYISVRRDRTAQNRTGQTGTAGTRTAQTRASQSKAARTQTTQCGNEPHKTVQARNAQTRNAQAQSAQNAQAKSRQKKKKRKKKKSFLKRLLIILVILSLLAVGAWYYGVNHLYGKVNYEEIPNVEAEPMKEEGVINILLIGNDSRTQGEDGRSDAMILLSISNETKTIHLTSLLRDMYVQIPGYKDNRLNAAYSYGGAQLLMETLEQNLDIHVNRYVLVNFQAFANLVDAVGGVDLELTEKEVEYINGYLVEYNILEGRQEGTDYLATPQSGLIHLNGPQALSYCRNRLIGTDFGRTERQRKVLTALIQKAPAALLTNGSDLINSLLPNLTTNLTEKECRELTLQATKILTYDIVQGSVPIEGSYSNATIREMSVLQVDFEANKEYLRTNIYGDQTQEQQEQTVQE